MTVIKAIVFTASMLAIPALSFLAVLWIVFDLVRNQQNDSEGGF